MSTDKRDGGVGCAVNLALVALLLLFAFAIGCLTYVDRRLDKIEKATSVEPPPPPWYWRGDKP